MRPDSEKIGRNASQEKAVRGYGSAASAIRARLDQMIQPSVPTKVLDLNFRFGATGTYEGPVACELREVQVAFGGEIKVGPFNLEVRRGERIALLGDNGTGKTTLIRLIVGDVVPTVGQVAVSPWVKLGYVDQYQSMPHPTRTVLENVRFLVDSAGSRRTLSETRKVLANFHIDSTKVNRQVETLSPGERLRVLLAGLVLAETNLLLLDEPTNHLDIDAIEMLEVAVRAYTGTIIVVSHDRDFVDAVRPSRSLHLDFREDQALHQADVAEEVIASGIEGGTE